MPEHDLVPKIDVLVEEDECLLVEPLGHRDLLRPGVHDVPQDELRLVRLVVVAQDLLELGHLLLQEQSEAVERLEVGDLGPVRLRQTCQVVAHVELGISGLHRRFGISVDTIRIHSGALCLSFYHVN